MKVNISDGAIQAQIEGLEASGSEAATEILLWDKKLIGFAARIYWPSRKVRWVYKKRVGDKQKWFPLGDAPTLNAEQARTQATILAGELAAGRIEGLRRYEQITWGKMLDKFKEQHLPKQKKTTRESYTSVIDKHLRPAFCEWQDTEESKLRELAVHEIKKEHVVWLHNKMAHIPRQANVAVMLLRVIFERAEGWGHIEVKTNPVVMATKAGEYEAYDEEPRPVDINEEDLARLGQALETMEAAGHNQFAAVVRVLLFSGARLSEVLGLRWDMVNEKKRRIDWPTSKTGKIDKALNESLFEVLAGLPRHADNPWVFPTLGTKKRKSASGHLEDIKRPWKKLLELAGIDDLHRHDLRHVFGNQAAEEGFNLQTVAGLLSHKQTTTTERYSKVGKHKQLDAANKTAGSLKKNLKGGR